MHFPAFPPGLFSKKNYLFTIHDASVWKYSNTLSWKGKFYMKPLAILGAKRANKILTVSENSKKDISEYANIPKNKIINTYESISENFRKIKDKNILKRVKEKYNLPLNFVLSVCSLEPRKNLINLLKAFKLLLDDNPKIQHKLVLIGRRAWGKNLVTNKISELNLKNNVIITGHVPEQDLICIYTLADLFVFPSIYEGFGLPPLEAMACGTPVISSNTSSLPEVVGNAAIMINPYDVKKIANAINTLLCNPKLKNKIILKGEKRVKKFSWERIAKKMIYIY